MIGLHCGLRWEKKWRNRPISYDYHLTMREISQGNVIEARVVNGLSSNGLELIIHTLQLGCRRRLWITGVANDFHAACVRHVGTHHSSGSWDPGPWLNRFVASSIKRKRTRCRLDNVLILIFSLFLPLKRNGKWRAANFFVESRSRHSSACGTRNTFVKSHTPSCVVFQFYLILFDREHCRRE